MIVGGKHMTHDCGLTRSIGYFLEGILPLALFSKNPLSITFTGITNEEHDPSVWLFLCCDGLLCAQADMLRTVTLPFIKKFGVEDGLELKVDHHCAQHGCGIY